MVTRQQFRASILTVIMVISTFGGFVGAGTVAFSDTAAAQQSGDNPEFNVTDGYQNVSGGQSYLAVTVNSTSDTVLTDFNAFYNDSGPLNLSQNGFRSATYGNGTTVTSGSVELNRTLGGGNVTFILNNSQAPFTKQPTRINVTTYGNTNPTATSAENKSVLSINYAAFNVTDATGTPSKTIFQIRNSTTNDSLGIGISDTQGYFAQHCAGFISGGQCVDANGNQAPLRTHAGTDPKGQELYKGPARISEPVEISAIDISDSNASGWTSVSPESPATLSTTEPRAAVNYDVGDPTGQTTPKLTNVRIVDPTSDTTVVNYPGKTPSQLQLNKGYKIVATVSVGGSAQTINRSYIAPTKGLTELKLQVADSTVPRTTVTGQIINDSGASVSGAVVSAQRNGPGDPTATNVINSSTTGPNGKFSMRVPDTDQVSFQYQFQVTSNQTNGSTPVYYPTSLDNDGRGYEVSGTRTVLPPLSIESGGQVDISISSGGTVSPIAISELSRTTTRTGRLTRSAVSSSFGEFGIPGIIPTAKSAELSQASPTTDANSQVSYNVWGFNPQAPKEIDRLCVNTESVSQGVTTESACQLTDSGRLNLSVQTYGSIVNRGNSRAEGVADFGFWTRNTLIIRNASTEDVVTVLGPEGTQTGFLSGFEGQTGDYLSIPLPPGKYTVGLRPAKDYVRRTSVQNQTNVTITAGQENTTQLSRGEDMEIAPAPGKFTRSLSRSKATTLAVYARDPATGAQLSGSDVDVTGQLQYRNGTTAGDSFFFSYDSQNGTFSTSVNPETDLGVAAGKYKLRITASNTTSTATYNTTVGGPVTVTGFQTGLDTGGFSFGTGESVSTTVYAYNTTSETGITATGDNVSLNVYNTNGQLVTNTTGNITDGRGPIDLTLPSDEGFYRIETLVTSDADGAQGVSERPVRVADLSVGTDTNKNVYSATDAVELTVDVEDVSSGVVSGASVEAVVASSGESVREATDANGEVTFTLDPATFAADKTEWQAGTSFVRLTVVNETQSGVTRVETGVPFRVQKLRGAVEPAQRTFSPDSNATIDVFVPPNSNVNTVDATALDGENAGVAGTQRSSGYYQVDLGKLSVGRHRATITVSTPTGDQRDFSTQFRVSQFNVEAGNDKYLYAAGEQINTSVTLLYGTNGSVVSGQQVNATLYEVNPSNEINQSFAVGTTGSDGQVTIGSSSFNSSSSGRHYVEVEADGETTTVPLRVNNINVSLLDSSGGTPVDEYTATPGGTVRIYVNATNATTGSPIDGATAQAVVSTSGETIPLNRNTTTNGETILKFSVPESVPERQYGVRVGVRNSDGDLGVGYRTLRVSGPSISGSPDSPVYGPGDDATLTASVTYPNGTGIQGRNVTFSIDSQDNSEITIGTAVTGPDGTAILDHTIDTNRSDGLYFLEVSNGSAGTDSTGFRVSSLDVSVSANQSTYAPGDTIGLTIDAVDASGQSVNATGGRARVASPLGTREAVVDTTGSAPYTLNLTIPDQSGEIGSYTFQAGIRRNASIAVDSTSVEVVNSSATLNVTAPDEITADEPINVTLNASAGTTASLSVFSPGSGDLVYENDSISLAANTPQNVSLSLSSPGVYVIRSEADGIGTTTVVRRVTSEDVSVTTGPSLSSNASEFNTTQDIYISTNEPNATATIIGANTTYTVPLNQESGATNYGAFGTNRTEGIYLVRLDLSNSTAADSRIIEVSN